MRCEDPSPTTAPQTPVRPRPGIPVSAPSAALPLPPWFSEIPEVDRWPETGYVKKLQRRDNTFYYYNKQRECEDKEVHKVKVYAY
ncbi:meiosis expressed gene 1 protein homolog isoform X2 [Nannospalax galili]|uniref:meiosis expressed gene 1 protein homolog isoform X2 n=1 Tax=Nannospalax galili TaxID=1026970 RepID=UPI00111C2877|nr:meiosis expressed gene 1 protein homolog isoform X2 [Nannospalax galili]